MNNKTWLILVAVLVGVILYLHMCRGNKTVIQKPVTVPVEVIKKEVTKNESQSNRVEDSLKTVISRLNSSLDKKDRALQSESEKTFQLQDENDHLLSQLVANDLTSEIVLKADQLKASDRIKDSLCKSIETDLKAKISSNEKSLDEKDNLYKKLKSQLDTCLKNQTSLDKYADKVKPTNKLSIGIVANVYPYAGIGIGSDIITKKGMIYSGQGIYMQRSWYFGIGFKKVISFR